MKFEKYFHYFIIVFLLLFPILFWAHGGNFVGGDDTRLYYLYPLDFLHYYLNSIVDVNNYGGLGYYATLSSYLPMTLIYYLLFMIFGNFSQFLFFGGTLSLGYVGIYKLVKLLLSTKTNNTYNLTSITSGLVYITSMFLIYNYFITLWASLYLIALFPRTLYLWIKGFTQSNLRLLILGSIIFALFSNIISFLPWILGSIIILMPFLIYIIIKYIYNIKYILIIIIIFIGLNLYNIPIFIHSIIQPGDFSPLQKTYNNGADIKNINENVIVSVSQGNSLLYPMSNLFHKQIQKNFNWGTYDIYSNWDLKIFYLNFIFIFAIIFSVIFGKKSKNQTLHTVLLSSWLLGIFLFTVNVGSGGLQIFIWLNNNIPGFSMFRNMYDKFGLGLAISFSLLVGLALSIFSKKNKIIISGIIILISLFHYLPFIIGTYYELPFRSTTNIYDRIYSINKDFLSLIEYLKNSPNDGRYLWLPLQQSNYLAIESSGSRINNFYLGASPIAPLSQREDIVGDLGFLYDKDLIQLLFNKDYNKLGKKFQKYNVKYLIVKNNISNGIQNSYFFSYYKGADIYDANTKSFYDIILGDKVKNFGSEYSIYKINDIFSSNKFFISGIGSLSYQKINNYSYKINILLSSGFNDLSLIYNRLFNPERKLYPGPSWTCDQPHTMTGQDIQYQPILAKVNTGQTLTQLITQHQITTGEILDRNTGVTVTGGLRIGQQIIVGQQTGTVREYQTTECLQSGYTFFQGEELGYLWKKPLRDEGHTMVYDYANGWDISLTGSTGSQILAQGLQEGWIRPHTDGSYQVDLVLYFRPQSWFYLGLMISGTALIGLLSRLLYGWVRERRTREDAT